MQKLTNTKFSRRALIATAVSSGLVGKSFSYASDTPPADNMTNGQLGLVSVYKLGPVTLHTFMAPSSSAVVTTQIVETSTELHIIDTQFLQAIAKEARDYANSLGKPIAGVYLSHWHPDHLLGASHFSGLAFSTTADISSDCRNNNATYVKRKSTFKDSTPLILPEGTLEVGETTWDGLQVNIKQFNNCESEHALTFHIPEAGLMIVQDLMFNNAHSFPLGNHANWIKALESIRETDGLRLIGCGHGLPATAGAISDSIAYLEFQKAIFSEEKDAESASDALKLKFPEYDGESSLRFISLLYK